jgi:hypothetical protein
MKSPKPIKSFKHKDAKRAHIPSAEEAGYGAGSQKVQQSDRKDLPLNPIIGRGQDPELFWMHKYGSDAQLTAGIGEPDIRLHLQPRSSRREEAQTSPTKKTKGQSLVTSAATQETMATVEIVGLDIYDPIKDEVKSRDVHDIAY